MAERPRLLNIAYRLVGSLSEAEDVVQETYARWYALEPTERAAIVSPGAWLTRVASRICLDLLRSARSRRERYVGEWIPEPVPDLAEWVGGMPRDGHDPADRITLDESINMAFLVVLESMTPAERVAFILHDVFGFSFPEVAEIVGRSPAACRQLASSARRRLRNGPPSAAAPPRADAVRRFAQAWQAKDIPGLLRVLDPDATVIADGGGLVSAELEPIAGAENIARYAVELVGRIPNLSVLQRTVNGQPGLVLQADGETIAVLAIESVDGRITRIWTVRNPDKLRSWTT